MPAARRLNKVLKELNISMGRAVDFLEEKGIEIERRPTTKIDENTYDILVQAFQKDAQQKAASEEVVLSKIPEEPKVDSGLKSTSDKVSEKAKETVESENVDADLEVKDLESSTAEESQEEVMVDAVATVVEKEESHGVEDKAGKNEQTSTRSNEVRERATKPGTLKGLTTLGKIELPESNRLNKKDSAKKEASKKDKTKSETLKLEAKKTIEKNKETPKSIDDGYSKDKAPLDQPIEDQEPEKIETKFQKLDGPNFTGKKVDLSAFKKKEKPKTGDDKKKRKRISKNPRTDRRSLGGERVNNNRGRVPSRGRREPQVELTEEQVQKKIKETLEQLTNKKSKFKGAKHRRDKRKERQAAEAIEIEKAEKDMTVEVTEFVTVNELSSLMDVSVTDIISACMTLGIMVTMNQRLEAETIQLVAEEFGYEAKFNVAETEEEVEVELDDPADLKSRAPIVTVMGHVDHGKTSLLDYIRKANVIAGESGGITQHIGAYSVNIASGQRITFLDTPGHEAFTAMRARGAQVTDLTIIVVAADDQVMPQTKEAIAHAQAANVPMIIAVNKIDKPDANPQKVYEQLAQMDILVEEWGGKVQSQEISAKKGLNIDDLLEKVVLEADLLELQANPDRIASGTIVEASLDKGRGYVSTIIVQNGTLKIGDYVLAGSNHGKVRAMLDERGKAVKEAGPSTPVSVLGLDGAPTAGDKFKVYSDEREAKQIASRREQLQREQTIRTQKHTTLDEIGRRIALGDFHELNIILKGDVDGSVEALTDSLQKLSTEEIQVNILHKGVGQITESDVLLATASEAVVIGFNVRPATSARQIADKEDIEIRTYSIIYDAINDVKEAMEGMLSPDIKEEVIGNVEIRDTFKISKVGTIAGCMVLDGKITRNSSVRIIRDGVVQHEGELASLKRYQDDAKEVTKGYECGLNIKNYNNIEVGDLIEVYQNVEVKKKLNA